MPVQDQRQSQTEHCLEGDGYQRVYECILGGLVKDGVAQEINEIPEADKMPDSSDHAVRQGEPDAEKERVSHEGDQEDGPGQHEDNAEIPLPIQKVPHRKGFYSRIGRHPNDIPKKKGMDCEKIHPLSHQKLPVIYPFQLVRSPFNRLLGIPTLDCLGKRVDYDIL
jgi:hypothetical protein